MARSALNVLVGATITPLQKQLKKGVGLVKDFGSQASKAIAGGGGIGAAIGGAIGGVSVAAGMKIAVSHFQAVEEANTKLRLSIQASGRDAIAMSAQISAQAAAMSSVVGKTQAALEGVAASFTRFDNINVGNVTQGMQVAADMAASMGIDVKAAGDMIASALNNPREGYLALAAAGVRFSDGQIDAIQSMQAAGDMAGAQQVILGALAEQYNGAAKSVADNATNTDRFFVAVDNLAKLVGETLAPYMKAAVDMATEWVASLDNAGTRVAIIEGTAKAVGWVVDGVRVLNAAWKTAQLLVDGLVIIAVKGFKWVVTMLEKAVRLLEKIPGTTKTTSAAIRGFISDVEAFEGGLTDVMQGHAQETVAAYQAIGDNEPMKRAMADVQKGVEKSTEAAKQLGKEVKKGPVEAMKQLSKEAMDAQASATSMIKDMKQQLATFGMESYAAQAKQLEAKGATKGQVEEMKKLGAQLKGKELAQSLETPFETFQREMKKLEQLAADGGIGGVDLERAKGKLVADLQGKLPQNKIQAGGALMAGSQEARSAILSFRNAGRNANPQEALKRLAEQQQHELEQQTRYLKKIAETPPRASAAG